MNRGFAITPTTEPFTITLGKNPTVEFPLQFKSIHAEIPFIDVVPGTKYTSFVVTHDVDTRYYGYKLEGGFSLHPTKSCFPHGIVGFGVCFVDNLTLCDPNQFGPPPPNAGPLYSLPIAYMLFFRPMYLEFFNSQRFDSLHAYGPDVPAEFYDLRTGAVLQYNDKSTAKRCVEVQDMDTSSIVVSRNPVSVPVEIIDGAVSADDMLRRILGSADPMIARLAQLAGLPPIDVQSALGVPRKFAEITNGDEGDGKRPKRAESDDARFLAMIEAHIQPLQTKQTMLESEVKDLSKGQKELSGEVKELAVNTVAQHAIIMAEIEKTNIDSRLYVDQGLTKLGDASNIRFDAVSKQIEDSQAAQKADAAIALRQLEDRLQIGFTSEMEKTREQNKTALREESERTNGLVGRLEAMVEKNQAINKERSAVMESLLENVAKTNGETAESVNLLLKLEMQKLKAKTAGPAPDGPA